MFHRRLVPLAAIAAALTVPAGASAADSDSDNIAASASVAATIEIISFDNAVSLSPVPGTPDSEIADFTVKSNNVWGVTVSGETLQNDAETPVALSSALQMRAKSGAGAFVAEAFGSTASLSSIAATGETAETVRLELKQSVTYADAADDYTGTVPVSVSNAL